MPDRVNVDDVVVLLPGILGSVLGRDGAVWEISPKAVIKALTSLGGSLKELELTAGGDRPSPDGVKATGLFKDTQIIPNFWKIDGYEKTGRVLKQTLALEDGDNYFEFPYDWRLDNRVAARQLADKVGGWLEARKAKLRKEDVKLILLAHSMGGLVSRYFIECLGGWSQTRMLITFGTPYHGSVKALGFLVNGYPVRLGPIEVFDFSKAMRSFPSVYQLLPTYDCLDLGSTALETLRTAGDRVPHLDPDMLKDAEEFHDEIVRGVQANAGRNAAARYEIHPIVGTEQPTPLRATINGDKADMHFDHPKYSRGGDTTVPWISAHPGDTVPVEAGTYFIECHGSLQNSDDILVDVRNLITRLTEGAGVIQRAATADGISLYLEDWFAAGPVEIAASTSVPYALHADIVDVDTGAPVGERVRLQLEADGRQTATIPAMTGGVYRVTVAGDGNVRAVTDVFMVLD
jgi:hypothetical protein